MKNQLRLVTFDITNTLLKFRTSVGEQYTKIGKIYGVEADPEKIDAAFAYHWKFMRKIHPNFGLTTGLTSHIWWKELIQKCFANGTSNITQDQLLAISDHLFKLYATDSCWKVSPGAFEQLNILKNANLVLGVISNFDERLNSVLISTGLKSYFNFVIASYVSHCEKPNKEIFDLALKKVQHLGIECFQSLHIGDNIYLDYLAAKNAGWNALLLKDSEHGEKSTDDFICKSDVACSISDIGQRIMSDFVNKV